MFLLGHESWPGQIYSYRRTEWHKLVNEKRPAVAYESVYCCNLYCNTLLFVLKVLKSDKITKLAFILGFFFVQFCINRERRMRCQNANDLYSIFWIWLNLYYRYFSFTLYSVHVRAFSEMQAWLSCYFFLP